MPTFIKDGHFFYCIPKEMEGRMPFKIRNKLKILKELKSIFCFLNGTLSKI
jgi:hypothetical protein